MEEEQARARSRNHKAVPRDNRPTFPVGYEARIEIAYSVPPSLATHGGHGYAGHVAHYRHAQDPIHTIIFIEDKKVCLPSEPGITRIEMLTYITDVTLFGAYYLCGVEASVEGGPYDGHRALFSEYPQNGFWVVGRTGLVADHQLLWPDAVNVRFV